MYRIVFLFAAVQFGKTAYDMAVSMDKVVRTQAFVGFKVPAQI